MTTLEQTSSSLYRKQIVYDRETRDYAMYLDGELVGFARTFHQAEVDLDTLVYELLASGITRTATELDGGDPEAVTPVCPECGKEDCPGNAPEPAQSGLCWCVTWMAQGHTGECPDCRWRGLNTSAPTPIDPPPCDNCGDRGGCPECDPFQAALDTEQEDIRIGDRVVLAQPNGYHLTGVVRALPGFIDMLSGKPTPYYSVDFACADGQTENLWPNRHDIRPEPSTTDRGLCFVCGRTEHTPETCPRAALHAITVTAFEPEPVGSGPDDGMTDDVNAYMDALDGVGPWPEAGAPSEARVNWSEGPAAQQPTPLPPVEALRLALEKGAFGLETLSVLRASYEAATPTTECACCNTTQPCYDDGEALICVDRKACRERCQAPIEQCRIPPDFDPGSRADQMDYVELPQLNAAYDAVKDGDDGAAIEQAAAALNAFYARKRDYLQAQRA